MYRLTAGFDANEETWKLDDRTHPHGKTYLRELITNGIDFLKLNFGLDRPYIGFVPHKQYTCDIRFGIYEVLDLIKVGQGEVVVEEEEEEEEEDEQVSDEADWE